MLSVLLLIAAGMALFVFLSLRTERGRYARDRIVLRLPVIGDTVQFALVERGVLPHLASFLRGGGRKIDVWYATLRVVAVPFDDEEAAFRNINTADELAAAALPANREP